ncbi:uncharacterized protein TRIADDRAFT_52029 [Trichoplax adhaerens]|uniref:TAFII28-like protein domain-containing protein n=1 Tax=Trichoplax adhaerens TaxID=10228 RepID=B3RLJ9_TRIAD|nr:hypothetical protein TRIADDRAFT_52029 [Trichoplax adhaerens]EDV29549.1 hypothetical protein TRIADDRAFT_52029 [Trichoplax adhaerens]|eukprot:XP_002108751.1 hypothetical protein TRIADDRAFT_52029 [Trichoplax adhaerens]
MEDQLKMQNDEQEGQQRSAKRSRDDSSTQGPASHGDDTLQPDSKKIKRDKVEETGDDYNFAKPLTIPKKANEITTSANNNDHWERRNIDEETERMQLLVASFTEEQHNRYEMYRRAAFPKSIVKRLIQNVAGSGASVPQNVVIAMSGIAKVFVGESVELALDIKEKWNDSGPIQPKHLREAIRKMKSKGLIPHSITRKNPLHWSSR